MNWKELELFLIEQTGRMYHDFTDIQLSMNHPVGNNPTYTLSFTDGIYKYATESHRDIESVMKEFDMILSLPITEREKIGKIFLN